VRPRTYGLLLSLLAGLFLARVAGQALVAFLDVSWLPPTDAWYSGLLLLARFYSGRDPA
jgi:hypothetical protein